MTLQEQIAQMRREIEQWQKDPSGSAAMKRQLQALQSELDNLVKRTPRADRRRPRLAVVKPTPPPQVALTDSERAVWSSFFSFHKALLQYSGWVNRTEWLQMADVAADMTGGNPMLACDFPTQPGIWVWDGSSQLWVRSNGLPLPAGVQGVYGWDAGNQRWVLIGEGPGPDGGDQMGVTDGSNAPPGMIGEVIQQTNSPATFNWNSQNFVAGATTDFTQVASMVLPAGDWMVTAGFDMFTYGTVTMNYAQCYFGPQNPGGVPDWFNSDWRPDIAWFITAANDTHPAGPLGPIRINAATSTVVIFMVQVMTTPVIQMGIDWMMWARRVR